MSDVDDLIPVPRAAERAGVPRQTMSRAARLGTIKARKMGRDWFVYASDLSRWLKEVYRPDMARRYPTKGNRDEEVLDEPSD